MPYEAMFSLIEAAHIPAVKFHIGNAFSTDPVDVEKAIKLGVSTIVLRTDDGMPGYQYETVQKLIESPGGIGHFSYASLFAKYPHVTWWIEIGNEPNLAGVDGWHARWWALAVYKELALNYLGHIDAPWREKYPNLKWSVCLPTDYSDAEIMLRWLDSHGSDFVGDGSIIDYYDALNCHLYGDYNLGDGHYEWSKILDMLVQNKYTKTIHITEIGINDPSTPMTVKTRRYHDWISHADKKIDLCLIWVLGQGTAFPHYEIHELAPLQNLVK